MSNHKFFRQALSRFTHDFANGDIIRKYTDRAYSISEIEKHLDFPSPREEIHKIMWEHLLSSHQIRLEEPGKSRGEKYTYVKDISPLGKVSFRKVIIKEEIGEYVKTDCNRTVLKDYLKDTSRIRFVEIPFGVLRYKDKVQFQKILNALSVSDARFIEELFTEARYYYYRLNERMTYILLDLLERNLYQGNIYSSLK